MKKSFAAQIPASVLAILSLLGFATGWIATRFQAAMEDFHIDMEVYRAGGRAILDNTPLYDHWFQAGNIQLPFTYPPFGALILTPLSIFDFMDSQDSSVAMIYFSSLLMLLCLFLVARTLLGTLIDAPKHSNPATTLLIIFRIPKSIPIIFSARICATRLIMAIRYPHPASQSHCQ